MGNVESRIAAIHRDDIIVDCHLDLGMYVLAQRRRGRTGVIKEDLLEEIRSAGVNVIVSASFLNAAEVQSGAAKAAHAQIDALRSEESETPESIAICVSYSEILAAVKSGKIALIMSFEGAEPIEGKPRLLREFYDLGVRGLGVSWSRPNFAAEGAPYTATPNKANGLTELGKRIVREAWEMGYFIDVTHLNDPGISDVIALGARPIIASHTNSRSINPTPRNLSDEYILCIAETGGVIGMNQVSALVADDTERITMDVFLDHFDHIKALVGAEHMGLGFDLCNRLYMDKSESKVIVNGREIMAFDLLADYRGMKELSRGLIGRGYSDEEIKMIYGGSVMRVFEQVLR